MKVTAAVVDDLVIPRCLFPPLEIRFDAWLEYREPGIGNEWTKPGRTAMLLTIPGPDGYPLRVFLPCRPGSYRAAWHAEGRGPAIDRTRGRAVRLLGPRLLPDTLHRRGLREVSMEYKHWGVYHPPRTLAGKLVVAWAQWRARHRREVPDGRDYTGWQARVVSLPRPGLPPGVGAQGLVTTREDELHEIELPGVTWVTVLPTRHIELTPPAVGGPG